MKSTCLPALRDKSRASRDIFWKTPWIGTIRIDIESSCSSRTILPWWATRCISPCPRAWPPLISSATINCAITSSPARLTRLSNRVVLTLILSSAACAVEVPAVCFGELAGSSRIASSFLSVSCVCATAGGLTDNRPSAAALNLSSNRASGSWATTGWPASTEVFRHASIFLRLSIASNTTSLVLPTRTSWFLRARSSRLSDE
ncbi:MAG: hypothetical protein NTZ17_10110 [Phycisphaerae bacterium]|nr:hypothetical protein [Phycisphaerae bacterium]